jgi:uncharacterized membrane protein YhaH (DUF805 family)
MKRMIAKPQLGFSEAVKLAFGKITQMSGRSRRSEFWWFMLVYVIGYWVLSTIAAFVLPVVEAQIAAGLIMLVALPATARRLHDTGHGSWWVIASWALNIGLSIYMITSGFLEEIQSINADPFKAIGNMNLPLFGIASLALAVTSFATFIFCLLDSDPLANKYGESPKYEIVEEDD